MTFCQKSCAKLGGVFLIQQPKTECGAAVLADSEPIDKRIPLLNDRTDPFECVAEDLALVETNLSKAIRSREQTLTNISAHLIDGGGKRVRPLIALLAYRAFGGESTKNIVDIATAIELIHTATLLHDDIIDGAETRRGKVSAYRKFGLKSTLVAGDFLFIKAFEFAGKFDDQIVEWTADACAMLTEGEVLQGFYNRNLTVQIENYVEIVKRKTASLFQTGARIGSYLAGAPDALVSATEHYGLNMGIAFQMVDDILDVTGHAELLGKPTGMDLRDGNPALPILLAIKNGDSQVREIFKCDSPSEENIQRALESIKKSNAINQARDLARQYASEALRSIKKLQPSVYRDGLKSMVELIIDRDF